MKRNLLWTRFTALVLCLLLALSGVAAASDATEAPAPTPTSNTTEPTLTPEPTEDPQETPPGPTDEPTEAPTEEPTEEPTATPDPTEEPTPRPTKTPKPDKPEISGLSVPSANYYAGEKMNISYAVSVPATVYFFLMDEKGTKRIGEMGRVENAKAGSGKFSWNGLVEGNVPAEGKYTIMASAETAEGIWSKQATCALRIRQASANVEISSVSGTSLSVGSSLKVTLNVKKSGSVRVDMVGDNGYSFTIKHTRMSSGRQSFTWNGKYDGGYAPHGNYKLTVTNTIDGVTGQAVTKSVSIKQPSLPISLNSTAFTTSVVVIRTGGEKTQARITSKPGGGSTVARFYGELAAVTVLGTSGKYSYVEAYNYNRGNRKIRGYVLTSKLKRVEVSKKWAVIIDKSKQRLHIIRDGKYLYKTMKISTGASFTTPSGTFITGTKLSYFDAGVLRARYAIRINGGIYIHEVPHKNGNYAPYEAKLGRKASGGCIRSPRGEAKWMWDNLGRNAKVFVVGS